MKKKRFYLIPTALAALAALAAGIWLAQTRYMPQAPEAPALAALWQLSFPDIHGQPQPMSQWGGQVVVLNFWASWCAPCREEMPDFVDLRTQFRPSGVEFVGIAIDNPANVAQFLQQQPVNYPILIGEGRHTAWPGCSATRAGRSPIRSCSTAMAVSP
jgi:thiol-disulfide isomerase/thioredoxin